MITKTSTHTETEIVILKSMMKQLGYALKVKLSGKKLHETNGVNHLRIEKDNTLSILHCIM